MFRFKNWSSNIFKSKVFRYVICFKYSYHVDCRWRSALFSFVFCLFLLLSLVAFACARERSNRFLTMPCHNFRAWGGNDVGVFGTYSYFIVLDNQRHNTLTFTSIAGKTNPRKYFLTLNMRVHADRLNARFDLPRALAFWMAPYIAAYLIRNNYLAEVYISKYTDKGRKSTVAGNFFFLYFQPARSL